MDWDSYLTDRHKPKEHKPRADAWEMASKITGHRLKIESAKAVLGMGLAYQGDMTPERARAFMRKALEELE